MNLLHETSDILIKMKVMYKINSIFVLNLNPGQIKVGQKLVY